MNKLMLIDGDNLLYRAYFKFGGLTSKGGASSSMVYGFPYILRSLLTKVHPDMVISCFDGGRNKARLDVLPGYKVREQKLGFDKEDFVSQKETVMGFLPHLGVWVSQQRGLEADDLIYSWVRYYKAKGWEITIVSGDKDFHQLIDEDVKVYVPSKEVYLNLHTCKHYYFYTPAECVDYLILDGDKSDKIPGVPGMGEKTIRKFLDEFGSIQAYLDSGSKKYPKVTKEIYLRNRLLIDLAYFFRKTGRIKHIPLTTDSVRVNMIEIAKISRKYDINTFVKTEFVNGYKKLDE